MHVLKTKWPLVFVPYLVHGFDLVLELRLVETFKQTSFLVNWLQLNDPKCSTYKGLVGFGLTFSQASFLSVFAVSVDRFLAVHLHLRYQELVTHKRVVVVVIATWILSASNSLLTLLNLQDVCLLIFGGCRGYSYNYCLHQDLLNCQTAQESDTILTNTTSGTNFWNGLFYETSSFSCQFLLRIHLVTSLLFAHLNLHEDWKYKCRQKEIFGSIGDISVSQFISEPFNLQLEDEKHEALNHKCTAERVSEPKTHFTFIIGVTLLCQESLHPLLSMLIIANLFFE